MPIEPDAESDAKCFASDAESLAFGLEANEVFVAEGRKERRSREASGAVEVDVPAGAGETE